MKNSQFVSSMAHAFRRDVRRTNIWNANLDATTNWAVIVTAVSVFIAFSQPNTHHGLIILSALFVPLFLFVEASRFRDYELWNYRMRLMEMNFFAALLDPPYEPQSKWSETLLDNVLHFNLSISLREALGLRVRRHYPVLFLITVIAWIIKYWLLPTRATSLTEFISRARIGMIPGSIVVSLSLGYFGALIAIFFYTLGATTPVTGERSPYAGEDELTSDEILVEYRSDTDNQTQDSLYSSSLFLVSIVTSKTDAIAKGILREFGSDVTVVPGKTSMILVRTLAVSEIKPLRRFVVEEDPQATIHIFGRGIDPLSEY